MRFQSMIIWFLLHKRLQFLMQVYTMNHLCPNSGIQVGLVNLHSRGDLQWMLCNPWYLLSCRSCLQEHWAQFTFSELDKEKQGMLLPKRFSFLHCLANFRLVQLPWACAQNLRSHTVAISTNTMHSVLRFSPPSNTAYLPMVFPRW